MILGSYFLGDDNVVVQRIQEDCCGDRLCDLWRGARDRYLAAERTLGIDTELGKAARTARSFDHRTLQCLHDLVAASFRCRHAERLQPDLPGLLSDLSYEERITVDWIRYFAAECEALAEFYPDFPRLVLEATVYPSGDPRCTRAAKELALMVDDRCAYLKLSSPS